MVTEILREISKNLGPLKKRMHSQRKTGILPRVIVAILRRTRWYVYVVQVHISCFDELSQSDSISSPISYWAFPFLKPSPDYNKIEDFVHTNSRVGGDWRWGFYRKKKWCLGVVHCREWSGILKSEKAGQEFALVICPTDLELPRQMPSI